MTGGVLVSTPAGSVRGPKFVVTRGKTPVLSGAEMRQLLKSIDTSELIGLRDRALLGLMGYSFARVSAVVSLRVEDYFQQGRRSSGSGFMRKVANGMRCPAITAWTNTLTPGSPPPALTTIRRGRYSGPLNGATSSPTIR